MRQSKTVWLQLYTVGSARSIELPTRLYAWQSVVQQLYLQTMYMSVYIYVVAVYSDTKHQQLSGFTLISHHDKSKNGVNQRQLRVCFTLRVDFQVTFRSNGECTIYVEEYKCGVWNKIFCIIRINCGYSANYTNNSYEYILVNLLSNCICCTFKTKRTLFDTVCRGNCHACVF